MIKYNYKLKRKFSECEIREFCPTGIPTELPNLVYIEGPNSLGKSTLLNIIALSFLGAGSSKIHPALRIKMDSLLNSDYQTLDFKIEISSEKEELLLRSEKSDPERNEIIVQESLDGSPLKILTPEKIQSKYNLIYDIPSNPLERMYDLLKELQDEQVRFGNRFKDIGWLAREVIKEIDATRNPQRLQDIINGLKSNKEEFNELKDNLPKLEEFLDSLEKNVYVHWYYWYLNECETLKIEKERLEKVRSESEKKNKQLSRKIHTVRNEIPRIQGDIFAIYSEVTKLVSNILNNDEKKRFKIWKEINTYTSEISELDKLKNEATHYEKYCVLEIGEIENQNSFKDANVLFKIIQSLESYEDSSVLIPKLKVTIGQIIEMMKEENNKNFILLSRHETLGKIREKLEQLIEGIELLKEELKEANETILAQKESSDESPSSHFQEQEKLSDVCIALSKALTNRDTYLQKSISQNFEKRALERSSYAEIQKQLPQNAELKNFLSLTESQITQKIAELDKEIVKKTDRMKTLKVIIEQYQKEKDELENIQPHKFEKYKDNLNELFQKSQTLSSRLLSEYSENIIFLMERKVKASDIECSKTKKRYYDEVAKYLANKIGVFTHIGDTHTAKIADLISGVIITTDNRTIHLLDMGMGQSQSTYLKSLLNVENDNRKIIALFDEIASMDTNSLKPIFSKLCELYEQKRLLLAVLVQRSDELKVKKLVD